MNVVLSKGMSHTSGTSTLNHTQLEMNVGEFDYQHGA